MNTKTYDFKTKDQSVIDLDSNSIVITPNISTKDFYTSAGSKMLENYKSIFNSTVAEKLEENIVGQGTMPEFGVGQGEYNLAKAVSETGCIGLMTDSKGDLAKEAHDNRVYGFAPSYGLVSRYGLIGVTSSMDTLGILSKDLEAIGKILNKISDKDEKDSASIGSQGIDYSKRDLIEVDCISIEDTEIEIDLAPTIYEILSAGEFATNMEKYDGIVYGYRTENFENIDDLYKNSRSEGLGEEVRNKVMFGNFVLLEENYEPYYEQAMRARTYLKEQFEKAFESNEFISCPCEEKYTIGAKLAGIPYIYVPNKDKILMSKAFNEKRLLDMVEAVI